MVHNPIRQLPCAGKVQRVVIKVGTNIIAKEESKAAAQEVHFVDHDALWELCYGVHLLRSQGISVLLVSSGAVHLGSKELAGYTSAKTEKKQNNLHRRQALSALGQASLVRTYQKIFHHYGIAVAQLLLTARDFSDRRAYLNMKGAISELLGLQVLPIINENDITATDELQFGENDFLSAACAALFHADYLLLLSSVEGFLLHKRRIAFIEKILPEHWAAAKGPELRGSGGMSAKLHAAQLCAMSGIHCAILPGKNKGVLQSFFQGEDIGTLFPAGKPTALSARKKWLLFSRTRGTLVIDTGAARALEEQGASLLAVGLRSAKGRFWAGEVVQIEDEQGRAIGRGIVNYHYRELMAWLALQAKKKTLEQRKKEHAWLRRELVHRNDLVLMPQLLVD